ncbi:hypothetical protein [Stenotrophomonas maltophilia]|uniref:hypothetical protein n=1 Tax=Stenotrophomonas maltophilia TaxID=40324 RepID=UPI00313AD193
MATYEQGLLYEAACELLNGAIGSISTRIRIAEEMAPPDAALLQELKQQQMELGIKRENLQAEDDAEVRAIIQEYRKPPQRAAVPTISGS